VAAHAAGVGEGRGPGIVGGIQVLPGFWRGGGFAARVGCAQRDDSGGHQAEGGGGQGEALREIGGLKLYARSLSGVDMKDLKSLADEAKQRIGSGVVAIVARSEDGRASIVVGVTDDLLTRHNAVDLVRVASATLGGKGGGGRPDMAQAGGPDGANAEAALEAIAAALRAKAA